MPSDHNPELSVIVPILNEADELPYLFETLTRQTGISFELILCDGGSFPEQQELFATLASDSSFETQIIKVQSGRGRQMNAGAAIAKGKLLMFLHADSRFSASDAIVKAVSEYMGKSEESGVAIAAHFTLNFRKRQESTSLAYYFYEAKTCLNRKDCIRGDQGFLLNPVFFRQVGGFDESLPYLEDLKFVNAVAESGEWISLPASVSTSARRFDTEGLFERQTINAIIVNSLETGWDEFFHALPGLYRCHPESGRLQLFPLFDGIRGLLGEHSCRWLLGFWFATGQHVAANIWQLFFWLDARSAFLAGLDPDKAGNRWTCFYGKYIEPTSSSRPFAVLTACAVWGWYRIMLLESLTAKYRSYFKKVTG